ncbi:MAG: AsmA family protein [Gammaproteobacteria bacterium]|jgi:AsmA protein
MKLILKILGILVAIPVVLFIIAAIILATIDLNEYRDPIAKSISDATGRQLTLKGDLEKSFFPWLGVKIGGVTLSNADGFKPATFAAIDNAEVRVDTLSLLRMQPAIDKLVFNGLQVNLARDAQGKTNWEDLMGQTAAEPPATPATKPAPQKRAVKPSQVLKDVVVGGIELHNANLSWDDAQANQHYEVKNLNVSVSEIQLDKPVSLDLTSTLVSRSPKLQADVAVASDKISWDLDQQHFNLQPLHITIDAQGEVIPGNQAQVSFQSPVDVHLKNETAALPKLALQIMGIQLNGQLNAQHIMSAPAFSSELKIASFSPQQVLAKLGMDAILTADPKVLQQASVTLSIKGDMNQLAVKPLQLVLDDTTVNGHVNVADYAAPKLGFKLDVDAIDADRYLPPPAKQAPQAAPTPQTEAAPAPETPLPIEPLRTLNLDGSLSVGKLTVSKIDIEQLNVGAKANKGIIHLQPVNGQIAGGTFATDIRVDATGEQLQVVVKEQVDKVQVEPLLNAVIDKDLLSGAVQLNADVKTQGLTTSAFVKALQGNVDFRFADGAVKGFNLAEYARQAKAKIKGESYTPSDVPKKTDFTEMEGKAVIKQGVVNNTQLSAKSPGFRIDGKGTVDLVQQSMNYLATAYVVGTSKGQGGAELSELKGLPIPVRIKGPFTNLDFGLDFGPLLDAYKAKYKKQLQEKKKEFKQELEQKKQELQEKKEQKVEEKKAEVKEEVKEKAEEETQKLKDKLKDRFKKLF